jgi:tRNA A-37 threonylcarbamoyl transferase component Bud32
VALILRRVGRYELLKEIGRGGMATVYLARQTDLDRHVALKELATLHSADEAFAERFLRESRMAGSLSHPNIVTVHDYFEHEGTPYISMEYIERGSLRPLVGELTFAQVAGVLEGLLAGLQHAASRGIVHRDMKPENVMVTAEGSVKISDFGIGRAINQAGQASRFLTATGTAIGTPAYMAPEQAMAKEVGPWTDLYSLGIMAYEMVLGEVPFSDSDTPMSMLVRHVSEAVPAPSTIDPSIDPQLSDWLENLLKKDPTERPKDAQEAWDKLEEIVIHMLGPRWRREARLPDGRVHEVDDEAKPLTPAPFSEERSRVLTPEPQYVTYVETDVDEEAAAAAPDAPPAPAGAEAELLSEAAPAEVPAAEQASPEEQEGESSLDLDGEDMYLTFSPGSQSKVSEPPPAPPPAPAAHEPPPVAPEPVAPEPVALEPMAPEPVAPELVAASPEPPPAPAAPVAETAPPAELGPPAPTPAPPSEPVAEVALARVAAEPESEPAVAAEGHPPDAEQPAEEERQNKRGLRGLKKPHMPKVPKMPQLPGVPEELQQFMPGVSEKVADLNAEVAAAPMALRAPGVNEEFAQQAPGLAGDVAEAQAYAGSVPGAGVPSAPHSHPSSPPPPEQPTEKDEAKKEAASAAAEPPAASAPPPAPPAPPASPASPPAAPPEPEERPADEPEPDSSKSLAPELRVTVPPDRQKAVERPSFILTDAVAKLEQEQDPTVKLRKGKAIWVVLALVVVGAIAAAAVLLSGGGSKKAQTTTTAQTTATTPTTTSTPVVPSVLPDVQPSPLQRVSAVAFGGSLYVAGPGGSLTRLALGTLKPQAQETDPAGPRSVAESGGRIYVADGETLTTLNASTLAPLEAVALPGAVSLAGGNGRPLVALQKQAGGQGQVCVVGAQALSPCASLAFVPGGAMVSGPGQVYVVDPAGGEIVPFMIGAGALTAGTPIKVGPDPQGAPVVTHGSLYVIVKRGIAVVDLATGAVSRTIRLERTPAALAIPQVGAKVFATLFGSNAIVIIDATKPGAAPVAKPGGKGPVAIVQTAGGILVVTAGSGAVRQLDATTGALVTSTALPALGQRAQPVHAGAARIAASGTTVRVTIPLTGGSLDPSELRVTSAQIAGGQARVELWQGGIRSSGGAKSVDGVSVRAARAAGRLEVTVAARAGDFSKFAAALGGHGRSVVLNLTEKPKPVTTTQPTTTFQQTTTQPQTTQPQTTTQQQQTTTTPPPPTTTHPPTTTTTPTQTFHVG